MGNSHQELRKVPFSRILNSFDVFILLYMCFICMHVCMCTICTISAHGSQQRAADPSERKLQSAVSHHITLETEPGTSARAAVLSTSEPSQSLEGAESEKNLKFYSRNVIQHGLLEKNATYRLKFSIMILFKQSIRLIIILQAIRYM